VTDPGDDPFGLEMPEEAARLRNGRYYFPVPGVEDGDDVAHTRMTNRVKKLADNYALEIWNAQQILTGIMLDESLYMKLCAIADPESKEGKKELSEIAALAKERAGGNAGARRGTAYHSFTEFVDSGHPAAQRIPSRYAPKMNAYTEALKRHRLVVLPEYIERRVRVSHDLIGQLDRILMCELTGKLYIADLKTQAKLWTYTEMAPQLAGYANASHCWNEALQLWETMPEVDKDIAIVIWMPHTHPSGNDEVEVKDLRIDRAWEVAVPLAGAVKDWQAESKNLASERPLPRP
jgi:hypothetical protein